MQSRISRNTRIQTDEMANGEFEEMRAWLRLYCSCLKSVEGAIQNTLILVGP